MSDSASPTWDQYMTPVLRALGDRSPLMLADLYGMVAKDMGLGDAEMREAIRSG